MGVDLGVGEGVCAGRGSGRVCTGDKSNLSESPPMHGLVGVGGAVGVGRGVGVGDLCWEDPPIKSEPTWEVDSFHGMLSVCRSTHTRES